MCYEALLNHEIDVYVEYTGTAEQVILKGGDLHPSIESINTRLDPALSMLASLGFNNAYAMALKASQAGRWGSSVCHSWQSIPSLCWPSAWNS